MRIGVSYLACCVLLSFFLFQTAAACWGYSSPPYGESSNDYDIPSGGDIVLNCSLKRSLLSLYGHKFNSDHLVFEKKEISYKQFMHVLDNSTAQLRIENVSPKDSGFYYCKLFVNETLKPVICITRVNIGFPPQPVENFTCISNNFEDLYCTWDLVKNAVLTNYQLRKYLLNTSTLDQACPSKTATNTSCWWTYETIPLMVLTREMPLTLYMNNSLGNAVQNFTIDTFKIVIPRSPKNFTLLDITVNSLTIGWHSPFLRFKEILTYEVWVQINGTDDKMVYQVGSSASNYTVHDLHPNVQYNVSVRCKIMYSDSHWSNITSLVAKTLEDVPYKAPDIIPEAYELHIYEDSRTISVHWKDLPLLYQNGPKFHYHVKYYKYSLSGEMDLIDSTNIKLPSITVKHLMKNESYLFRVFSANRRGISTEYASVFVNIQDDILPGPKSIRAISQDMGYYNLSWSYPHEQDVTFIVLWCPAAKPWLSQCDKSIDWIDANLTDNSIILNITDEHHSNYRFAVVAKLGEISSGMQWATCVVPHKAALGKIQYVVVEQKNSTALKVIWNLDCPAQKNVLNKYEITYCRIENDECKVAIAGPNAEDYLLQNLRPFSNYSIKIRAFNRENLPSEDSDPVLQSTLSGAPSEPPQQVKVIKSNSTYLVSWSAPKEPNGIITKYIINYNNTKMEYHVQPNQSRYVGQIKDLQPYTLYLVQIAACVNNDCSKKSKAVPIQTDIAEPGRMDPPRVETVNSTYLRLSWLAPLQPNGPIDYYIIEWHEEGGNMTRPIISTKRVYKMQMTFISLECQSIGDGGSRYLFYIRAVNVKNGTNFLGPLSEPTQITACIMSRELAMIIGFAIGGTLVLALLLLSLYKLVKWMQEKIHQVKNITIKLPKGLDGPEMNPLNNYERFKQGLQDAQTASNDQLTPASAEKEKYRHNSGGSHFSSSSTDALIFKNGKCAKFGRKPSGDSSGCSSLSSNTAQRTHLSSDSGTESDFVIPPSPDSALGEQSLLNLHKTPLPIVIEVHDQRNSELSSAQQSPIFSFRQPKYSNINGMLSTIDQPYSKFGVSSNIHSSDSGRFSSLAFYSSNLANSEPSIYDMKANKEKLQAVGGYSKVGLAKSSEDILTLASDSIGYSKFGFPTVKQKFSVSSNLNPLSVVIDDSPQCDWSKFTGLETDSVTPNHCAVTNKELQKCAYIKNYGGSSLKNSSGYVPFSDLKEQESSSSVPSIRVSSSTNLYSPQQVDRNDDYLYEINWPMQNFSESSNGSADHKEVPFSDLSFPKDALDLQMCDMDYNFKFTFPENSDLSSDKFYPGYSGDNLMNHSFENQIFYDQFSGRPCKSTSLSSDNCNLSEDSQSDGAYSSQTDNSGEIQINPMTLRNHYVPISALTSDRTVTNVPKTVMAESPSLCVYSNGFHTEAKNLLNVQSADATIVQNELSRDKLVPVLDQNNSQLKSSFKNGMKYVNGSLKHIFKPYPKMESEICEV